MHSQRKYKITRGRLDKVVMLSVLTSDYKNEFVMFTKLSEEIKNGVCVEFYSSM